MTDDRDPTESTSDSGFTEKMFGRIVGSVVSPVVDNVDLDELVERIDVNRMIERVDVEELVDRVDVDRVIDRVDLNAVLDEVDLNAALEQVDVNALLDRIDPDRLLDRIDPDRQPGVLAPTLVEATAFTVLVRKGLAIVAAPNARADLRHFVD